MAPDTPLFGRLTVKTERISLGRAGFATLFLRATSELQKLRVGDDSVIQIEMSRNKLPDSTTFDKAAIIEHQIAARTLSDEDDESPFPGITVGRVAEVMASQEYEEYAAICEPDKRMGLADYDIARIRTAYFASALDCSLHFPKWID